MSATAPGRREMLWWHQARHCIVRLRLGASGRSAVGKGEAAPSEDEAAPSGSRLPASRAWLQAQRQERGSMKRSMPPARPRWRVLLPYSAFRSLLPPHECHCPSLAHSRVPSHAPHSHTHYSRAFPAVHIESDRHAPLATVQRAVLEPIDAVREPRGEEHLLV